MPTDASVRPRLRCCLLLIGWLLGTPVLARPALAAPGEPWAPVTVDVWSPPFSAAAKRHPEIYEPLEHADRAWRICAAIPHLKDPYWLTVNFALVDQARRMGVKLHLDEAGGYENLDQQREQIRSCMASGGDALIVSGVSVHGLDDLLAGFQAQGKPVVDLINSISDTHVSARAAVSYHDNAYQIGRYLDRLDKSGKARILWFPGPKDTTWAQAADAGLREALAGTGNQIIDTRWGEMGREEQAILIERALQAHPDADYIVGTGIAVEAALDVFYRNGDIHPHGLLAYSFSAGVERGLQRGKIIAAATEKQGILARIGLDQAIRALENKPNMTQVGTQVEIVDHKHVRRFDSTDSVPPDAFRPVFSVDDWVKQH